MLQGLRPVHVVAQSIKASGLYAKVKVGYAAMAESDSEYERLHRMQESPDPSVSSSASTTTDDSASDHPERQAPIFEPGLQEHLRCEFCRKHAWRMLQLHFESRGKTLRQTASLLSWRRRRLDHMPDESERLEFILSERDFTEARQLQQDMGHASQTDQGIRSQTDPAVWRYVQPIPLHCAVRARSYAA